MLRTREPTPHSLRARDNCTFDPSRAIERATDMFGNKMTTTSLSDSTAGPNTSNQIRIRSVSTISHRVNCVINPVKGSASADLYRRPVSLQRGSETVPVCSAIFLDLTPSYRYCDSETLGSTILETALVSCAREMCANAV